MVNRLWFVLFIGAAMSLAAVSFVRGQAATNTANAALKNPASLKETAPAMYKVDFDTSVGTFVVEVHRDWAPNGADRFYNLVKNGFYDSARFFRVIPGFMVQFGINGDPKLSKYWRARPIPDDPRGQQLPAISPQQQLAQQIARNPPRIAIVKTSGQRSQVA